MNLKKNVICILSVLTLLIGCSSIQTRMATSINHYQDGETIGKGKSAFGLGLGAGQLIETEVKTEMVEDDDEIDINFNTKTDKSRMLVINSLYQFGLFDNFDIIGEGYISSVGIGGRCNLKYRFNHSDSHFGISIMPGIGYSKGLTTQSGSSGGYLILPGWFNKDFSLSSSAISLEINLPMSYRMSKWFATHLGLHLSKYFYNVSSTYEFSDSYNSISETKNFSTIFCNPGISMGLQLGYLLPEIRIDQVDEDYIVYYGMCVKFNKK